MINYDLNFYQAIERLFEHNEWIRGKEFAPGCFLKLNSGGHVLLVDAANGYSETAWPLYASMTRQKYSVVTVATLKNLQ